MLLPRRLQHYFLGSLITIGSLTLGVAPQLEAKLNFLSWDSQAIAQQQPTATEITKYAEAYLAIYGNNNMNNLLLEVESLIGKKPSWEIRCDQADSINRLNNRQAIAKVSTYCNETLPNLVDNYLPRATFNRITSQLPNSPALQAQIQDAMLEILKKRQGN